MVHVYKDAIFSYNDLDREYLYFHSSNAPPPIRLQISTPMARETPSHPTEAGAYRTHFRTYMFVCSQTWPCFGSWDTLSLKHVWFLIDGKPKHYWLWIINFQMHRAVSGLLDTQKKYWLFCRHGDRYGTPSSVEFSFWK